jgi:hypothetical protein
MEHFRGMLATVNDSAPKFSFFFPVKYPEKNVEAFSFIC